MAYLALARKYRPSTFVDIAGQDSVVMALGNALKLGREPHAVIFSGIRGVGKTTVARVYAKALNCVAGPTPQPCGQCESCVAISEGHHEDVLEIDGASNTSVDDIRQLRETIDYIPQRSKFKVYIIDEVHMLSQSAFNALLKTLEEPPGHVVFMFATTELGKIPETILSRCQTFYLQRLGLQTIVDRLRSILQNEGVGFDERALHMVAKSGRGSMRDALTFLDQVIALSDGAVTSALLTKILPHLDSDVYVQMLAALIDGQRAPFLDLCQKIEAQGIDFEVAAEELASTCRNAFLLKDAEDLNAVRRYLALAPEEEVALREIAARAEPLALNRLFRSFVKCHSEMDGSDLDRFVFENYGCEWILEPGMLSIEELLQGAVATSVEPTADAAREKKRPMQQTRSMMQEIRERSGATASPVVEAFVVKPEVLEQKEFPSTWRALVDAWKVEKPLQARLLEEAYILEYSPLQIHVAVKQDSLAGSKLLQPQMQTKILDAFANLFSFRGKLKVSIANESSSTRNLAESSANAAAAPQRAGAEALGENLLTIKAQERAAAQQALREAVRAHPLTQKAVELFGAEIESIDLNE